RQKSGYPRGWPLSSYRSLIVRLAEKNILISSDHDDDSLLLLRQTQARAVRNISLLYHLPTDACNYFCSYCFIESKIGHHAFMTKETSRKGIEYFAGQSRNSREIKVTFYGGEPLLNKEVVYDAIEYIRQLEAESKFSKPVDINLLTNGSLVDRDTIAVLKEHHVKTSVSIDGPEQMHNQNRFCANGRGSFDDTIRGYRLLQDAGLKPGVSCTLGQHNIDRFDELLAFIIDVLKPAGMGFNILLPKWHEPYGEDVEAATAKIIAAFKVFRERGIFEDRMMRRARPFCADSFHFKDCYGVGGQIVLTPEGRIGPCQAYLGLDRYFPVSVQELPGDINSHPMFAQWIERFTLNNSECLACRALAICGGGCPYAAEVMHGSIDAIDRRVCQQCLPIFDWLIWDLFEHLDLSSKEEPV
ncbi:MAG TPA: radical SAM protein, partial [Opitutaceae bacterium]|nr:radical SAM protein [Opitutaceae bacterium]